jgi:hypothetical protein
MTKYISHIKNLRIVITPGSPIYKDGQKVGDLMGKYAQFSGGMFETDDQEIIDKLNSLPTLGIDFNIDSEETAPAKQEAIEGDFTTLTKPQLLAKAAEIGLTVPKDAKKEDIVALLTEETAPAKQEA